MMFGVQIPDKIIFDVRNHFFDSSILLKVLPMTQQCLPGGDESKHDFIWSIFSYTVYKFLKSLQLRVIKISFGKIAFELFLLGKYC